MAGDKLTSHDLYGDDSRLVLLDKQLKGINIELDKIKKQAGEMNAALKSVPSSTAGGQKKISAAASDADKLVQAEQKLLNARSDTAKQLATLQVATARANAENRAAARLALATKGAEEQLAAQYIINTQRLVQMTRATKEQRAEYDKLQKETREIGEELRRLGNARANDTRNVGNYTSGLRGLYSSLKQLAGAYIGLQAIKGGIAKIFGDTKELDSLDKAYLQVLGSSEKVADAKSYLEDVSKRLGVELIGLSKSYLRFRVAANAGNLSVDDTNQIFEKVAKAASFMGLSIDDQQGVFRALEQILSKGTVQSEELRGQLGDRLPGAFIIAAKAMNVTTGELGEMLKAGKVVSAEFLPKFAAELEKTFGLQSVNRINNVAAAQGRFNNEVTNLISKLKASNAIIGFFDTLAKLANLAGRAIEYFRGSADKGKNSLEELSKTESGINQVVRQSTVEFNSLIGVMKRLAPESEARKQIIDEINSKYGQYLSNLLTEKSSLEDIAKAQKEANKALQEKAFIDAFIGASKPIQDEIARLTTATVAFEIQQAKFAEAAESGNYSLLGDEINALANAPFAEARKQFEDLSKGIESNTGLAISDFIGKQLEGSEKQLADMEGRFRSVAEKLKINFDELLSGALGGQPGTPDAPQVEFAIGSIGHLRAEIDKLEDVLQTTSSETVLTETARQIVVLEQAVAKLQAIIDKAKSDAENGPRNTRITAPIPPIASQENLHESILKSLEGFKLTDEEKKEASDAIGRQMEDILQAGTNRANEAAEELRGKQNELKGSLFAAFGLDLQQGRSGFETLLSEMDIAKQRLIEFFDLKAQLYEQDVQNANAAINAAQDYYNQQVTLAAAGHANRLADAEQELALSKKKHQQALAQQAKFTKAQLAANTALEASNLVLAVTNILKDTAIPFPLNLAAVGVMLGAFSIAKVQAFRAANKKIFGKGDVIDVQGGSHTSGNDTPLGISIGGRPGFVEQGEKVGIINKRASRKYGSSLNGMFDAINRLQLEQYLSMNRRTAEDIPLIVNIPGSVFDSTQMERGLDKISRQLEGERIVNNDGSVTVIKGNHKTTYRGR
jgi:tape measure domain-containing protein